MLVWFGETDVGRQTVRLSLASSLCAYRVCRAGVCRGLEEEAALFSCFGVRSSPVSSLFRGERFKTDQTETAFSD